MPPADSQAPTPSWDDLRVFLAILREGTFAAAGRRIGVNATTAARRLASLEASVGAQLFSRTRDGLVPTAAAERMREPSELIERQVLRIQRRVAGGDAQLAGRVRLNSTESLAVSFLVERLAGFRREHPDIELELTTGDAMVDLTLGHADLVIRHRAPGSGPGVETLAHVDVVARRLGPIALAVFASEEYLRREGVPEDITDVRGHSAVLPEGNARYLPGSSWALEIAPQLRTSIRTDSVGTMHAACRAGFGLCMLPCFPAVYEAGVVRVSDVVDTRDTWLLMPGDLRRVARVRALWDYLLALFEEHGPVLAGEVAPPGGDARHT